MSKLPENWKPCEVNYPPNLSQGSINLISTEYYNSWWVFWDLSTEEFDKRYDEQALWIALYKQIPKQHSKPTINAAWSNVIDANL